MKNKPKQIIIINSLRGLAALSVCLYHFIVTTTGFITNETILDVFHYGNRGVQLFFIISGVVIPLSMIKSNYKINLFGKYLLRRFIRIEPPYLIAVALGLLYLYARNFVPSSSQVNLFPSIRDIILHIGYLVPFVEDAKWIREIFWTLSVEFQYYIFLATFFPLALSDKKFLRWGFNILILTIPFLVPANSFFIHWAAYFGVGIFYALYITKKYTLKESLVMILFCSLVIYKEQGLIDLSIALGALSIIHFFPNSKSGIGLFLGKISYSFYLLHSIIGLGYINFMSHLVSSSTGKFLVISSGLVLSIISAYIFWKFIEKPSQLRSQKIKIK